MSGQQQFFDEEFRAMMERVELRDPPRYYGALSWLRPLGVLVLVLALMTACTALAGPYLYAAPLVFIAGVFSLAKTIPSLRLQSDAHRLRGKLRSKNRPQ